MSTIATLTVLNRDYALTPPTDSNIALVFVHGWLLSRHYWTPLIQQLAPHYQCLSYDLRGFGRSAPGQPWRDLSEASLAAHADKTAAPEQPVAKEKSVSGDGLPHNDYSLQCYAEDLQVLLTQLQVQRAWIIGHSLGGSVALWAADLDPVRVEGVVCVNAGGGIYLEQEFAKFRNAGQQMLNFRPTWLRYAPLLDRAFRQMAVKQPLASSWGKQRLIDFLDADLEAARSSLLSSTTQSEVHRLPQIVSRLEQPAYFIAGAEDEIMAPRYVRHLASFHRSFDAWGENVLELSDCGHLAMLEHTHVVAQYIQSIVQGIAVPACI